MVMKHKNLVVIGCLLLGFLPGLFLGFKGGMGLLALNEESKKASQGQSPEKTLRIKVSTERRNELVAQLDEFANANDFAIRIEYHDPNRYNFSVYLWRADIWATGDYPVDPETLSLAFYDTIQARPVPASAFDVAVDHLKGHIGQIPGATFVVDR